MELCRVVKRLELTVSVANVSLVCYGVRSALMITTQAPDTIFFIYILLPHSLGIPHELLE